MNQARILHCIPGLGGGGAERQLAYLAAPLRDLDWDVHVALVTDGPNFPRLRASGATLHRLSARNNYDPRLLAQLARTVSRVQPDLIQGWILQMEIVSGLVAAFRRIPWILSERSAVGAYPSTLKNGVRQRLAGTARAIVANSAGGKRYWDARLPPSVPRYIIPNAIPQKEIDEAVPADVGELDLPAGRPVVLFVGRFSAEKNVETFCGALQQAAQSRDIVAIAAGDGPLRGSLKRWVAEHGLSDRVRMPGYLENVWQWMKRASVFVSPSVFEGHPNAVLEAMACRCPLVVSDIPAHREFLDERTAVLVPPGDPEPLADAVLRVLSNPAEARIRAERAAEKARQWSVERVAHEYDRVYREVLNRTSKSSQGAA